VDICKQVNPLWRESQLDDLLRFDKIFRFYANFAKAEFVQGFNDFYGISFRGPNP